MRSRLLRILLFTLTILIAWSWDSTSPPPTTYLLEGE